MQLTNLADSKSDDSSLQEAARYHLTNRMLLSCLIGDIVAGRLKTLAQLILGQMPLASGSKGAVFASELNISVFP